MISAIAVFGSDVENGWNKVQKWTHNRFVFFYTFWFLLKCKLFINHKIGVLRLMTDRAYKKEKYSTSKMFPNVETHAWLYQLFTNKTIPSTIM